MQPLAFGKGNDIVAVTMDKKEGTAIAPQGANRVEWIAHQEPRNEKAAGHMGDTPERRLQDDGGHCALPDQRAHGAAAE